jgi:nucleoredoxin
LFPVFYDDLIENHKQPFEIVFVSSDETEDDMKAYIDESHGDWWYIPFDDESTKT